MGDQMKEEVVLNKPCEKCKLTKLCYQKQPFLLSQFLALPRHHRLVKQGHNRHHHRHRQVLGDLMSHTTAGHYLKYE